MTTALNNNLNAFVAAVVQRAEADSFARMPEADPAPGGHRLPQWTGNVSPRSSTRPAVRSPRSTAKMAFKLPPILPTDALHIKLLPMPYAPGRKPVREAPFLVQHADGEAVPRRRISANKHIYRPASLSTLEPTITLHFGPSTSKDAVRFDASGKAGRTTGSTVDPAPKLSTVQREVHGSTRPHATPR